MEHFPFQYHQPIECCVTNITEDIFAINVKFEFLISSPEPNKRKESVN
jgi:hypothetical protein